MWIFLAGIAYLILSKKKKPDPKPKPKPYKFPDTPMRTHFATVVNKDIRRIHWNLEPAAVNHYGFNSTRGFGISFESLWNKAESETDGTHSWNNHVCHFKKDGNRFLLDQWNEEFLNGVRLWAEECLKYDLAFIYSIFTAPTQGYAGNNDRGLIARNNQEFFNTNGAWWQSGMIHAIIRKTMDVLEGMPNVILEVGNEPFPFNHHFHEHTLHYIDAERHKRGWQELRYQVNPNFDEAKELGRVWKDRLYISTHTHNTSLGMWNNIRNINPHSQLPGGAVRSWDNGSYRNFLGQTPERSLTEHLKAADRTGNSWECLFLDNHERMYNEARDYLRQTL